MNPRWLYCRDMHVHIWEINFNLGCMHKKKELQISLKAFLFHRSSRLWRHVGRWTKKYLHKCFVHNDEKFRYSETNHGLPNYWYLTVPRVVNLPQTWYLTVSRVVNLPKTLLFNSEQCLILLTYASSLRWSEKKSVTRTLKFRVIEKLQTLSMWMKKY